MTANILDAPTRLDDHTYRTGGATLKPQEWTCYSCLCREGGDAPGMIPPDLVGYRQPDDPDARCASCDERPPDRERQLAATKQQTAAVEHLRATVAAERGVKEQADANARAMAAVSSASVPKPDAPRAKTATSDSMHVSKREAARMLAIGRSGADNTLTLLIKSGRLTLVPFLGKPRFLREDILKLAREGLPTVEELRSLASSRAPLALPRKTRKRKSDAPVVLSLESWRAPKRS